MLPGGHIQYYSSTHASCTTACMCAVVVDYSREVSQLPASSNDCCTEGGAGVPQSMIRTEKCFRHKSSAKITVVLTFSRNAQTLVKICTVALDFLAQTFVRSNWDLYRLTPKSPWKISDVYGYVFHTMLIQCNPLLIYSNKTIIF